MALRYFALSILIFNYYLIAFSQTDWTNWGNNQICYPKEILYPKALEDVIKIIKQAASNNLKIRAVGSGHSWSNLVNTDGYIINTDYLNRVLYVDKAAKQVKVEAGIKLKDLYKILAAEGLALPNQGFISEQSIAGAICTGTHGTGHTGCLSDFITEFEIIDGIGNIYKVTKDFNSDWLPLLRISLGALGFIYSVTIQCQDLFILNHRRELTTWQIAINNYKENYNNNEFYMFMGHPTSDIVLNFFWNRTDDKNIDNRLIADLPETIITSYVLNKFAINSLKYLPGFFGDNFIKFWLLTLQKSSHNQYSYLTLSPLKHPVSVQYYIEEEIAVPMDNFPEAITKVRELYSLYKKRGSRFTGLITCRFVPKFDLSYLSLSYKRDTAFITLNIIDYFDDYEQFFKDFEQILEPFDGRPHWGKFHFLDKHKVLALYGENISKFNKLRQKLDPSQIFSNDFIKRCFG